MDLKSLTGRIDKEWAPEHSNVPNILYHYTSSEALSSIIKYNKCIWASDIRYLNDYAELGYGKSLIAETINTRFKGPYDTEGQKRFVERAPESLDVSLYGVSLFTTSFCEHGDLLSQWRTYNGDESGYSLGFDLFHFVEMLPSCKMRRVIYDRSKQVRLISNLVRIFLDYIGQNDIDEIGQILPKFSEAATEIMISLKHPSFSEEREWRLVYYHKRHGETSDNLDLHFRPQDGDVVPYVEIDLGCMYNMSKDDTRVMPFPLREVIIGPTANTALNSLSIQTLVSSIDDQFGVEVMRSRIPVRRL